MKDPKAEYRRLILLQTCLSRENSAKTMAFHLLMHATHEQLELAWGICKEASDQPDAETEKAEKFLAGLFKIPGDKIQ